MSSEVNAVGSAVRSASEGLATMSGVADRPRQPARSQQMLHDRNHLPAGVSQVRYIVCTKHAQ